MGAETEIMKRAQVELTADPRTRLFRNNVGSAWQGVPWRTQRGELLIRSPRLITFGLCEGSGDLIGWRETTITPDMVGRTVAIFASLEIKTAIGVVKPEQKKWDEAVRAAGGISGFARSTEDARAIIEGAAP
jgi:hypothetical protein